MTSKWPNSEFLTNEVITVLKNAGGELSSADIDKFVISNLQIDPELLNQMHSGKRTEISYRLAWIRTKAKQLELIERTISGKWMLTKKGKLKS